MKENNEQRTKERKQQKEGINQGKKKQKKRVKNDKTKTILKRIKTLERNRKMSEKERRK